MAAGPPAVVACGVIAASLMTPVSPAGAVAGYGDVAADRYYAKPVQWSVDNNITGIDGACFAPDAPVSRGETAVYVWNMEGQPEAAAHSFADVTVESQNAAISWMAQTGITTGTSDTTFSPEATLTRAQLAAFLHRLADKPAAAAHPFTDVVAGWQQAPVSWMAASGHHHRHHTNHILTRSDVDTRPTHHLPIPLPKQTRRNHQPRQPNM